MESPQLQCLWVSSSSWTRLLCPLVQRLVLVCGSSRRALWTISHIFYVKVELWILWSVLVSSCNMAEEEVAAFVVNSGSGMHSAGLLVKMHLALCSQRLPPGSACTW